MFCISVITGKYTKQGDHSPDTVKISLLFAAIMHYQLQVRTSLNATSAKIFSMI